MLKNEFALDQRQKPFTPTIYAYKDERWPGMLKVGYTSRTVKERMKEHYPTATPTTSYTVVLQESAFKPDNSYFDDHPVHHALERLGCKRIEIEDGERRYGEWFKCAPEQVLTAIESVRQGREIERSRYNTFPMRDEQKRIVEETAAYFESHPKTPTSPAPQYLWNCKMRFGKTFAAYELMKRENWNRVLVLTYKPAVRNAWREDLLTHVDFEGYQFISTDTIPFEDADKKRPIVWFASFQDFLGKDELGEMKPRNRAAAEIEWDCIIIDESHFGAGTFAALALTGENAELEQIANNAPDNSEDADSISDDDKKRFVAAAHLKAKNRLFLSGTPFKALRTGSFNDDAISSWTYSDEQAAKAEWDKKYPDGKNPRGETNPYAMLPELQLYIYKLPGSISPDDLQRQERNQFSLNEFFRANSPYGDLEKSEFIHAENVRKWLDMIRGGGFWEQEQQNRPNDDSRPVMPYCDGKNNLAHTVWYFQSVASCYAMRNLLRDDIYWDSYKVILCAGSEAGSGEDALGPVKEAIISNKNTITLSCGKLLTGVTIPEWSGIFMLNDKKTPEAYFQSAFRVQSPWYYKTGEISHLDSCAIRKKKCFVFDFSPIRALEQVRQYAEGLIANAGDSESAKNVEEAIQNFIRFLPIISCDESGMAPMDPKAILEQIYCGDSSPAFVRKMRHLSVHISDEFLQVLNNNPDLYQALRETNPDGLPPNPPSKQEDNKNVGITPGDGDASSPEKSSKEKKERKTDIEKLRDRIRVLCARIPLFMYLTDKRERDILECLESDNAPELFEKIVGINQRLFEKLLLAIDKSDLVRIIISFHGLEESSLSCYGINLHNAEQQELKFI